MEGMSGQEGGAPPLKDTGWWEERAGRVKKSYVKISDGA